MVNQESEKDFAPVSAGAFQKRHLVARDWPKRTLCGHTAWSQDDIDRAYGGCYLIVDMPPCKQCEKSRQRRIDGRSS